MAYDGATVDPVSGDVLIYNGSTWEFGQPGAASIAKGDLTTSTAGLTVGNGVEAVLGTGTTINYSLTAGLTALASGTQGVLGGTGTSNTYVGADGLLHLLPANSSIATGDLTTSTSGLSLTGNIGSVVGTGTTIDYSLTAGITALTSGTQGTLGGTGTTNTYVGADGQLHLLPAMPAPVATGDLTTTTTGLSLTGNTGAVVGTGATINYSLTSGITALNAGTQGTLGGTGTSNTYVGADGLLHLLPASPTITSGDITTTTTGLILTGNTSAVLGAGTTIDYSLTSGISALTTGTQGMLGGTGTANTYVGADGQLHLLPSASTVTTGDLTTTTSGMSITGGTASVVGAGTTVNYNLVTGISALTTGTQGVLGGTGTANTYVGADGQLHLLPSGTASITTGDLTTTTTGLTITGGTSSVVGTGTTVDYSLTSGIAGLTAGVQGTLGGTGASNTYVGADGQLHLLPSAPTVTGGDLTTTTSGLSITGGTASVLGAGTTVNYNLVTGISALTTGTQGVLGGTGTTNTYVGADGQLHLLPAVPTITSGDLTTTTTGLIITGGTDSVLGAGTTVDYSLTSGIAGLTAGTQGTLGGTGTANTYVGADGQLHLLPSMPTVTGGNLTTTTTGLSITGGTGAVLGAGTTVNYNLVTGIAGLTTGAQGVLGGTGAANTYVGADGLLHLLPTGGGSVATGDLTTSTIGLTIVDGTGAVVGTGTTIDINILDLFSNYSWGTGPQGQLGGGAFEDYYVGGDGYVHLLPKNYLYLRESFSVNNATLTIGGTTVVTTAPRKADFTEQVFRNGLLLRRTEDYTIASDGQTYTFTMPFVAQDEIDIIYLDRQ